MATRTYIGGLPAGRIRFPDRTARFERGVPLEVTDAEAALLDDEWTAPRSRKPKPDDTSADPTPGNEPTSKEH